jgi:hypothetical protein
MNNHLHNDTWLYRTVVAVLGLTLVSSVVGAIVLTLGEQSTPEVCVAFALGSIAIVGFVGLLALLNR